jgi:SAM-dependent methyltransferase
MPGETGDDRAKRLRQRVLFDAVADLYEETRAGYPTEIIDELFDIAALSAGSPVLEVGCGTGQFTVELARRGARLTAIDLGAAMVAATTEKVRKYEAAVQQCPFEEFDASPSTFAAVVSATAFHWIDPDIAWTKSASHSYSGDGGAWATARRPALVETIATTGLFHEAVTSEHQARRTIAPEAMVRLEQTRATTLSYDAETRDRFLADLRGLLAETDEVTLTQETTLTMARLK